jgi:hypothetical protein
MCQNFDDMETALGEAIRLLNQVQSGLKEKKESKIKKKEKDFVKTSKGNNSGTKSNIYTNVYNIISHYQKYHPGAMRSVKKNSGIYKKIEGRLREGYSPDEICRAIDGQHVSPFHLGENKNGTRYLQLELVVRSGEKVDQFLEIFDSPKQSPVKSKTARSVRAAQDWLTDDQDLHPVQGNQGAGPISPQPSQKGWASE